MHRKPQKMAVDAIRKPFLFDAFRMHPGQDERENGVDYGEWD